MIKSLRILMTALLLLTGVIISEAQRIVGYLPSYRDVNLSTIRYSCLTDVYFSFINFDASGNLIQNNPSDQTFGFDMTKFTTVKAKCKPQTPNGPNLWISVGGADDPGLRKGRFATVCANSTARANLVSQLVAFANTNSLAGIDIDWEFPEGATNKNNHEAFMTQLRTAINTHNTNNPSKPLKLSMAVGGETNPALSSNSGHLNYCNAATIATVDYLHVMTYDLPPSYGADHTDVGRSQESINNWQAYGGATNAPWSKMTIGIAFYGRLSGSAPLEYNNLSASDASTVYNSTTGGKSSGNYWFDSKKDCEDKIDWIMSKGGSGVIIWDIGQDRNDLNLTDAICAKMATACAAPQPSLGTDKGVCLPGTITLNSNVATASGRTFTWKESKNGGAWVTLSETSPNLNKSTSGMTTGTYEYEVTVTQNSCSRTGKVKVVLSNPVAATGGTRCGTGTVTLNVTSTGGTYEWYDAASAGNKLATGASFTTPSISANTNYWVQEATGSTTSYAGKTQVEGTANPPGWALATPGDNGSGRPNYAQKITLLQSATIEKVTIFGNSPPYNNAKIMVYSGSDGAAVIAQSAAVNITSSPFVFPANITLPSGTYYVGILVPGLTGWTGPILDIKGTQGTFSIPGVMTLSNTCFNGNYVATDAEQTGYYGQLYNWVVTTGVVNPCPRTQVTATVNPAANQGLTVTAGPAVCSGVNGTVTVASSESGISYQAYKGATAVGTAVVGTGSDITLTVPAANLTAGANTITIQATKTGCGTVTLTNSAVITVNSAAAPSITFANINRTFGDAAVTLTATSPSGGAFTYSIVNSTPTGIANLVGNQITMTGAGTVNLKVDQAANGCYLAGTANATLTIAKANRTVTITSPNSGQAGTTVDLTHTANPAGGTATWSVTGAGASVTGTTLNLTAAGTVTVKVDIAAEANYNAASATQTFTIGAAASPTIVFNDINKVYGDAAFTLAATSNSSGALTYSIVNSIPINIVNLSGNQITITGAGTVTIKVDQAASSPYGAGSKTITLTIAKANRTVSITSPNSGQVGTPVSLTHTANPAGGTATWSVTGTGASVTGTTLNLTAVGTVTVKVDIAADANYNAASATQTFTINSSTAPTIVFNDITKTYGDADFTLSATSNSSGTLTYSLVNSVPTGIVTVSSSGLVHITGAGTATIKVDQTASAPYGVGSKTITLTVNKAVRTVTITSASSGQVGTTVNLTNTMNPTGGTATWSVTPVSGSATVSGTTLNLTGAGTVTVKVDVAADANYLAASATQTFTVNGASSPSITFNNVTKTYGDASFSMTASSPSLGAMTYSVQSSNPANIVTITSAGQVTILGAGTAVIKVDQVANGTYSAGSATATLTINKATRSITITSANSGQVGTTVNLTSTQNPTGGTETWSVTPGTGAATVTGTTLNLTSAGTVTVKVDVATDANYLAVSATQTFTVTPGTAPTITFTDITKTYGDAAFNLAAVSTSPGALTYSLVNSVPTSIVTVSTAGLVTISGAGTATIKVDQAASGTFAAASKTITLTINKATRSINITSVSNGPVGTTVNLAYTATPASTAGVWSVTPGTGSATISGTTLNLVAAGTVNVKVDIAADANYLAASSTQVFIINSGSSPVITFNNVTKTFGDAVFNMSATSTSAGAMTYTVANSTPTGIVSITPAGQVTILGAGTATIQVDQAADGTFSAGSATATLTINKATRTITITSPSSGNVGTSVTLAATVSPTGTIVWSVSNVSGAATVSGTTLNLTSPGTVTVRADIAGDANFNASFATQTFTINSGSAPTITFNGVTKTFGDASFSMTATSPSAGAMTYSVQSSIPSNIVTITPAGQVTILGAGTAVIKVDQVANGTFSAGSATATLTINKATRSVIITSASSGQIGTTVNLAHTANPTGGVATWSVTNVTGNATISGTTLNLIAAGTVTVKVDIAAEANYLAGTATQTFTINAGNAPVITYNNITKVFGDAPFNMTATSTSAGAMTYSVENSIPSNIVTITSSGQVTILGAGTATIKVNQAANGTFAAGSATAVLTINKATRNVTITSASSGQVGTSLILNSLVSPTGGTPTWSVTPGTGSATISGTTMNLVSAGTVTVKVDVAADANYSAATATQTFTINPGTTPTISLGNQFKVFGDAPFTVNATSNSPGAKTYSLVSSVPSGIVTVSSTGLVTILGAGTATIKVDQAASGSFGAGSATATITIAKANRTVTITSSNSGDAGTSVNLTHSVSVGAGVATWTVTNNTGAATVSGTSLSLSTAGLVTVKVTVEADANYNAATASQFFTINPPSDTPNPGTISGPTSVTKGNTYVYCVTNVPGTSYTWSYNGAGVTMINSTSNCVTISYSAFATPGTLSVVADIDGSGPKTPSSPSSINITVDGTTAVVKELEGVTLEAYPNPFEFASRIEFNLNSGSTINLEVYNMLGFKVKTILEEETLGAGQHDYELSDLANGVYIVRLKIGNKEKNIKVIKH